MLTVTEMLPPPHSPGAARAARATPAVRSVVLCSWELTNGRLISGDFIKMWKQKN